MKIKSNKKSGGWTIIELLIAILILGFVGLGIFTVFAAIHFILKAW